MVYRTDSEIIPKVNSSFALCTLEDTTFHPVTLCIWLILTLSSQAALLLSTSAGNWFIKPEED